MRRQKNAAVLVSVVVLLAVSPAVFAGPDLPVVSGSVATFTGNQSDGIWPGVYLIPDYPFFIIWTCPPVSTYNVHDLTTDITPAFGVEGIKITYTGPNGGDGGDSPVEGGDGGNGAGGENLEVNFAGGPWGIVTHGAAYGIWAQVQAGDGGDGGIANGVIFLPALGGDGGNGGNSGTINVSSNGGITTFGAGANGIAAWGLAGYGGDGGTGRYGSYVVGGSGGTGGNGNDVTVTSHGSIETAGARARGIFAWSAGGQGGYGGSVTVGADSLGGQGGAAGHGGKVEVTNYSNIRTDGYYAQGILGWSSGPFGGDGGSADVSGGSAGGNGGAGGTGGEVIIKNYGGINTAGDLAAGVEAHSGGGNGGNGGSSTVGAGSTGGDGAAGGNGGDVTVNNDASINTGGGFAYGIYAVSQGGDGGNGGDAYIHGYAEGGDGGVGGSGGTVKVNNYGSIETAGNSADGIVGLSLGGAGGNGGFAGGVFGSGGWRSR
jgi:hypothetical protein